MKAITKGLAYTVVGVVFSIAGVAIIGEGDALFGTVILISACICLICGYAYLTEKSRARKNAMKKQEEFQKQQEALRIENERINALNKEMKEGLWKFPSAKFYQLCRDGQATVLDNEFSIRKATKIAQQLILARDPQIDLECCHKYLNVDSLNGVIPFKPVEEHTQIANIVVNGGNADGLAIVPSSFGVVLFLRLVVDIEGVLASLLEIVDVLSNHRLSYLVYCENSQFLCTPSLKEAKGLFVTRH